jgi:(R,R)-butanediol dehydrogenase/meso-butanediol dehydrogenase/diacetyl reductase
VIEGLATGAVEAGPLHTSTVTLDALPEAFEALRQAPEQCKVLIDPAG